MSVNLNFIRLVEYTQHLPQMDGDAVQSKGKYFEILTVGWTSGSRTRVKRFRSAFDVLVYANKLHAGGWISDDSYDKMYGAICDFCNALNISQYPE